MALFSQPIIQKNLAQDYSKLEEVKASFRKDVVGRMGDSVEEFKMVYDEIQDTLEKILGKTVLIQKSFEDYIEAKRLAFPRFFFMSDRQFLDFIELAE